MRSNGIKARTGFDAFLGRAALAPALFLAVAGCKSRDLAELSHETGLGIHLDLKTATLSNGLKVILVEDHTVPIISYQSWFRVGSVDEKPGITGISHLFEHLMFKGTPKYGPRQFFQQLEAKGAEVNAFTTRDYTVYYEDFVPSLLGKVIDMESDRMANLRLDEETVNGEKMVVFEERKLRTDNTPDGRIQEALWALAYHVHPYQWPVIGYPQDLAAMRLSQIVEYFKAHYQPANAAIVVVGDFKAEPTLALIREYYGKIPAQPQPKRDIPREPAQDEERLLTLYDDVASERFAQAYHVPSATDDDSYALDVLAQILFGGTSARAYRAVVEEQDLAEGVSGSNYTPTYPGLFMISGTMNQGVPSSRATEALDRVIRNVQDHGVTDGEVKAAVRQLTVQLVDSVLTPHGLAMLIGTVQTILGDPSLYAGDLAKYMKVSRADVQRVAATYLVPNNRSVVVLKPKRMAATGSPGKGGAP